MVRLLSRSRVASIGLLISGISLYAFPTLAQIIPDQTLGTEASVIDSNANMDGIQVDRIKGGAARGTNLFHSFEQFNINESQHVYFDNPRGIETILTRVTGTALSEIMGTLGVDGSADLFLLNPNGIVFGENARLDVGGSFVATTADAFQFDRLGMFRSYDPEQPSPLLTIAPSAFLFDSDSAGTIVNQSTIAATYNDSPEMVRGLRVPNGETLGLLGGDVLVDGGWMNALGGRIEIGSVSGENRIGVSKNGSFQFSDDVTRGTVRLQNDAVGAAALRGGGDIRIIANTIDIVSSLLQTGIQPNQEAPGHQAGKIFLDATEQIRILGNADGDGATSLPNVGLSNSVEANSIGDAGIIKIIAPVLTLRNGAIINASVFGEGTAGRVVIEASDRVAITGTSDIEDTFSGVFSSVEQPGKGHAGRIQITTPILRVRNGARISSSVIGEGNGGNITIEASDRVSLDGTSTSQSNASGVFTTLNGGGVGKAGRIQITTPILNIRNGARLNSSTLGQGDGGSVMVRATDRINLEGSANDNDADSFSRISSEAFSANVSNSDDLSETIVGNAGRIKIITPILNVRDGAQIASSSHAAGNGGNIIIDVSEQINLSDSTIHASSLDDAVGQAGDITITTDIAMVENRSRLLATTDDGTGGNISLDLNHLFLLNASSIAAAAGKEGAGGDGGNITIDADFIVTLSDQDSDINANAYNGNGGNITIGAENLFNIEFQEQDLTPRNDITASSEFGLDGEVTIESPNVDPSRGTLELSTNLITVPPLDAICHPQHDNQSQFVMIGRGGLPPDPTDMLNAVAVSTPWVTRDRPTPMASTMASTVDSIHSVSLKRPIEAEQWTTDEHGRVMLVTTSPAHSPIGWSTAQSFCTSFSGIPPR